MHRHHFAHSTPVGCLQGFFWLALLIVDALGFLIWYRAAHAVPAKPAAAATLLTWSISLAVVLVLTLYPVYWFCSTAKKRTTDYSRAITR
ncbi:MAG: hypothetical protein O2955_18555 [Planctomycetota bacterium]|nr:hypothetical protein [Planctomycetota bacterium]MDA1214515.1 hypothetical protein [Planctomycetota bacterium]